MRILLLAAAGAALLLPAQAAAGRYAVGVAPGTSLDAVAEAIEETTGSRAERKLAPLRALVVDAASARGLRALDGVEYVERLDASRRVAFVPNDPLVARQWHLEQDHAFDFWLEPPVLVGPRVAVIDSGVDGTHPDLASRIAGSRSFVGGNALTDQQGHGTFIAGLIAAQTNNAVGVAGIAFPSQLLIAKVVRANRQVSLEAEAEAIRWAVDNGARVINLSLGGVRDPRDAGRDTYSPLEAAAVRYAYTRGVVVVAAVGNADQAPRAPWPYASYPAALPHVLGVSALGKDGSSRSSRTATRSTTTSPRPARSSSRRFHASSPRPRASCLEQGYSICGPDDYRNAEGTSFAAPQVAAAAALLLAARPLLQPDQVAHILTRSAEDVNAASGCKPCPLLRDSYSGWGRLNIAKSLAALAGPIPLADRFESNDDAGTQATPLRQTRVDFTATLDFWDDNVDVYKVHLRAKQRLVVTLDGPRGVNTDLLLWRPGTQRVQGLSLALLRQRVALSAKPGTREQISYRAKTTGWYYVETKIVQAGAGSYRLRYTKR